jgi:hypothetical protein
MGIAYGNPFKLNWVEVEAVIDYAKKLGRGQVVFKHPEHHGYNITFLSTFMQKVKTGEYKEAWIVYTVVD